MSINDNIGHMGSINFSVTEDLREFVEKRVEEAGFRTPSEYMRHLIREDRKRAAEERLDALLLAGLESGPAKPWTRAEMEKLKGVARETVRRRARGGKKKTKG